MIRNLKRFLLRYRFFQDIREKRGGSNFDLKNGEDPDLLDQCGKVIMKWPEGVEKPTVGVVKDYHTMSPERSGRILPPTTIGCTSAKVQSICVKLPADVS